MSNNHWGREVCANCKHQYDGYAPDGKGTLQFDGRRLCRIHSDKPPMPAKYHPLRLDLLGFDLAQAKPDWCGKWKFYI